MVLCTYSVVFMLYIWCHVHAVLCIYGIVYNGFYAVLCTYGVVNILDMW